MAYPGKGTPETGCETAPTTGTTGAVGGFAFIIVMFVLLAIIGAVIVGAY